jgi:hypothetical protein
MVRLITLVFLYINVVTNLNACVADDHDHDHDIKKIQESNAVARKTSPFTIHEIYVSPDSVRRFNNIFQKPEFWASGTFLSFKALNISCPQLFFYTISNKSLNAHLKSMHSAEPILNDIAKLSNQILEIYGLKNQSNFPINFNLIYSYDQTILREALISFLRIINTRDPNRTKGYEWKAQTFFRVFSQLCSSLNITEEDAELNLGMRQIVAISLGLSPLNYKEWFQEQYPALAKYIKTCARNKSRKPLAATFTLSLMHALIPKMYPPPAMQIAIRIPQKQAKAPQAAVSCVIPLQPVILCPTPQRSAYRKQMSNTRKTLAALSELQKDSQPSSSNDIYGPYFNGVFP